ncbi:HAMP domain-containing sensor histidine kinase [Streptomyces sp. SAJ15]|uniref:sensor histidine kinase n=1 Tax=Streptomyces sp. SAJ15 TaxID=2011095 RepID=UPI0011869B79|nr:HAMP domain-containing sensor histidine kinase [Streptomyces sp. SAJ15]TVL94202.1 two-component sensor histidine kinase [Streptomyces sp. SAJ15]
MARWFGSVRARAALGATLVVAVALVAAGLAVLGVLRANLRDQTQLQAHVDARQVAARIATGTAFDRLSLDEEPPVQVVDESGRVRAVSEDLQTIDGTGSASVRPTSAPPSPADGNTGRDDRDDRDRDDDDADDDEAPTGPGEISKNVRFTTGSADVDGESGDYRFAAVRAATPDGVAVTVYAGAPLATERNAVGSVRDAMLIGLPLLLAVVAAVTWLVTRRALRPVEGIRREMAAITASTDLTRRVPEPEARDEVAALARTTNETLAALETAVERQRRFVADASHELRSPIASLRTQLEVGAAHPELLDVDGAVEDVVRLQRLAADLLLLARLDAGERPPPAARVALAQLVREELAQRVGDRVPVRTGELPGVEVAGSHSQLARVLGNLLDNAQRHARGEVRVELRRVAGERPAVVLSVADDGDGVPPGDRERVFERFVRLDDARARDDGGAGLGLAIARDVARRHGGDLTLRESPTGGALFELRLPEEPS